LPIDTFEVALVNPIIPTSLLFQPFDLPLPWFPKPFEPERTDGDGDAHLFPHRLDPDNLAVAADGNLRPQIGVLQIQEKLDGFRGGKRSDRLEVNPRGAEITGCALPGLQFHIQPALETGVLPSFLRINFHGVNIPAGMTRKNM
jgi:hypothetical protein